MYKLLFPGGGRRDDAEHQAGLGPRAAERGAVAVLHQHLRRRARGPPQVARHAPAHPRRQQQALRRAPPLPQILRVGQGGVLHQVHLGDEHPRLRPRRATEEPVPPEH